MRHFRRTSTKRRFLIGSCLAQFVIDKREWIPVQSKLPRPNEYVLVMLPDGRLHRTRWNRRRRNWTSNPFGDLGAPIAWAKLSPLYQKDQVPSGEPVKRGQASGLGTVARRPARLRQ